MAISRSTAAAGPPSFTDSTSAAAMVYSPNSQVNHLFVELSAHDRDTQLFPALRDAAAEQKLPLILQKLLPRLIPFLTRAGEAQICKGFDEAYAIFYTDAGRKAFFGEDPPPDRMITKPTYATPFVTSVKLMQSIGELEQTELPGPASLQWSSVGLLHALFCHYYLFELNADTSIQHHPALVFWIKTIVRYEHLRLSGVKLDSFAAKETALKQEMAYLIARYLVRNLELGLRRSRSGPDVGFMNPNEFLKDTVDLVYPRGVQDLTFQAESFIELLDAQVITLRKHCPDMDPEVVTKVIAHLRGGASSSALRENGSASATTPSEPAMPQRTQDSIKPAPLQITPTNFDAILPRLDRADAHQLLVNLPLDIPSMETLNAIFARLQSTSFPDDALAPLDLDPTIIACGYIQHGLRQLERQRPSTSRMPAAPGLHDFAGASASASSSSTASAATATSSSTNNHHTASLDTANATPNGGDDDDDDVAYAPADDAADTKRKITLLLLFMRNLLRKNHVGFAALQYDIREICTRYSYVREVREFRAWIEGGIEG
ncbi:uncharacterized protein BKA78DRAFT_318182 [Phyllosticta capitalensis]|uniref:uncharacterized protein n=1 Tax=Phyllosticta capitalensis TaxID=121624 RepID=UPI0031327985